MSEWRAIDAEYEVSSQGHVRQLRGRELKIWTSGNGYMMARLSKPRRVILVHRAVATAFIPNPDNKPCVNHIDCIPSNNNVTNLEWCTQKENIQHAARLGRMRTDHLVGGRSHSAVLSDAQAQRIREMYGTGRFSWSQLAHEFKISKRSIGRIIRRESYANVQ